MDAARVLRRPVKQQSGLRCAYPIVHVAKDPRGFDLFYGNAGGKGYYRSAYEPAQYKALVAVVETGLTPAERVSLAGDEWAQVRANQATVGDYLDLVEALKDDQNAEVISSGVADRSAPSTTMWRRTARSVQSWQHGSARRSGRPTRNWVRR